MKHQPAPGALDGPETEALLLGGINHLRSITADMDRLIKTGSGQDTNLDAMDEHDATSFVRGLAIDLSPEAEYAIRHEDYVMEMPQSGERIRGRENLLALRRAYPAGVGFEARRLVARRDLGVGEYVVRYDGRPVNVLALVEFGNGKAVRETHYFAEPFEAPEWRSRWVEKTGA